MTTLGSAPFEPTGRFEKAELRITKVESFLVKPRWLFLKIHTDGGIIGLGEPILEGRALTCQTAVKELEPWLIGEDPTRVMHHWQAMYKHAFYRGGPLLTSVLSGIEQALWDISGKLLGVPVYKLLGGPTRDKIRMYGTATGTDPESAAASIREAVAAGFNAIKVGSSVTGPIQKGRIIEPPVVTERLIEIFAAMRAAAGNDVDIAIDFHGAVPHQTAKRFIKALEPYHPLFVEEPVQSQNVDVLADIAHSTDIPIATGERLYTKWGFKEVLEKRAASILQPDLSHAGGIMECRIIAGMAEVYYAGIAPHCPLGPIALASCLQLDASIPNFLAQEGGRLTGEGYIKTPFKHVNGYLPLPTLPGLGIELDDDALEDKIDHDWQNRKRYAEDGSAIDW